MRVSNKRNDRHSTTHFVFAYILVSAEQQLFAFLILTGAVGWMDYHVNFDHLQSSATDFYYEYNHCSDNSLV